MKLIIIIYILNIKDNPYQAAQEFIWKHELSQDFLDQIAMFIINNSKPITLDQNTSNSVAATPFTCKLNYYNIYLYIFLLYYKSINI